MQWCTQKNNIFFYLIWNNKYYCICMHREKEDKIGFIYLFWGDILQKVQFLTICVRQNIFILKVALIIHFFNAYFACASSGLAWVLQRSGRVSTWLQLWWKKLLWNGWRILRTQWCFNPALFQSVFFFIILCSMGCLSCCIMVSTAGSVHCVSWQHVAGLTKTMKPLNCVKSMIFSLST